MSSAATSLQVVACKHGGDSLAYMTPDLNGFQAFIAAKHFQSVVWSRLIKPAKGT